MDLNDKAALEHYTTLIEARFPPHLAAALAAARYAHAISLETPAPAVLKRVLETAAKEYPGLEREAKRAAGKIPVGGRG